MSELRFPYQPGLMLHRAIMGALRAKYITFHGYCREQGISPQLVRYATFGTAHGDLGQERLAQLIETADETVVRAAYLGLLNDHLAAIAAAQTRGV